MKRTALPIAAIAVLLVAAVSAGGQVIKKRGDLIARFDGGIHPATLPRDRPAAVAVHVGGGFKSASGQAGQIPQLRRITVAINREGHLDDRGLPVCHVNEIQPSTQAAARRICGDSIVGKGSVVVQVRIPSQLPYLVRAKLLAFNGPRRNGQKLIFAQAYARTPPGAFVLTFQVGEAKGVFGTVLTTTLPEATRRWAYLVHFEMTLHRTYVYRGQRHSYVTASCPAPEGFTKAPFPFARATYGFAGAPRLTMPPEVGTCTVAE